ncbi:ATP-binding cassette domain-containing protein [Actinopolymorpha sp. B17G11]|uniref:ABC transporter ATP-binding protein n=1 Tax=unclassified Actinopolymorpha TaxID=2627063 RepID=UPI0032D91F86
MMAGKTECGTSDPVVAVDGLGMTYRAPVRPAGLAAAFRALWRREYRQIEAVADVTFHLAAGELVGFIGPNGAGKTTTMKILSGILHPTAGEARVLGFAPMRRQHEFLTQIALVRGSQPIAGPTELTVLDNFSYRRLLYDIAPAQFRSHVEELTDMLDLEPLLPRQVRALSLGERMRAGLAVALLHRPRVLFLDEPTIGLDASAAVAFRRYIADYASQTGATVLLTSHYMAEVEALCPRVVLIDQGRLRYDGRLAALAAQLSPYKLLRVTTGDDSASVSWNDYGELDDSDPSQVTLRVPREDAPQITSRLLAEVPVIDLTVADPPLETMMDRFYRAGVA